MKSTLSKMPGDTQVVVACFDQEVSSIYEGKAGGFGDKEVSAITARGALGASNFEEAITWATDQAKRAKAKRVVVVGDGVATAGETDAQKLKERVEKMRDAGVERMDAIALGGIRDDGFLRTVRARRARQGRRGARRQARRRCARAPARRGHELRRAREGRRRVVVVPPRSSTASRPATR